MDAKSNRAFRLRTKSVEELNKHLSEHRKELTNLRINKVTSAVASKIAKIKVTRKAIARTLTIINEKRRADFKKTFSTKAGIKKFNEEHKTKYSTSHVPKVLRARKTRALRKALTPEQANRKIAKIVKRQNAFPQRAFFVKP